MLFFPNCKINLGLYVTEKRQDGYHNIETVFYPIGWCDALEILENTSPGAKSFSWHAYQDKNLIPVEENLVYKAWKLLSHHYVIPPIHLHFLKNIPSGAGLGGGSSDAAFTLVLLNRKFNLGISQNRLLELASELGSDCAFFIKNRPQFASGRGEVLKDCKLDLSGFHILLVFPEMQSNTADAYRKIRPRAGRASILSLVENNSPESWRDKLVNDFEPIVTSVYPEISRLISLMYSQGAVYSAMSGSGSTVYGLFKERPNSAVFGKYLTYLQEAYPTVS